MQTQTIWIVEGNTGEYDNRRNWTVCAYPTKSSAEKHVKMAQAEADRLEASRSELYRCQEKNPYDPDMSMDFNGTEYSCYKIELKTVFRRLKATKKS